jgi:hypothetical protein
MIGTLIGAGIATKLIRGNFKMAKRRKRRKRR